MLCMRQIIFTAALCLTSPLSQKTSDLETWIGTSLLYLMKQKRFGGAALDYAAKFDRGARSDIAALIVIAATKSGNHA